MAVAGGVFVEIILMVVFGGIEVFQGRNLHFQGLVEVFLLFVHHRFDEG